MTYLVPSNPKRPALRPGFVVAFIIFAVAAIIHFLVPHFLPGIFTAVATPFWRSEFAINSGSLNSTEELLNQNEELKRKIDEYEVRLQSIAAVEQENTELRGLLGRASTTPGVLAAVIKRPPFVAYDELIIDVGSDYGLKAGNKVYAAGNILIGTLREVLDHTSKVILLSSPGQRYEVLVGSEHSPISAIGRGGGQYEAHVPRVINLREGDLVIDASLNSRVFGIITAILTDPAEPFETILFAPPLNIYHLRWVMVEQ
jgi:cell shape-determining protein MreC